MIYLFLAEVKVKDALREADKNQMAATLRRLRRDQRQQQLARLARYFKLN